MTDVGDTGLRTLSRDLSGVWEHNECLMVWRESESDSLEALLPQTSTME